MVFGKGQEGIYLIDSFDQIIYHLIGDLDGAMAQTHLIPSTFIHTQT